MKNEKSCVVILSGGQDSGLCLALASQEYKKVYAITFNYGQRHRAPEIDCACILAQKYNAHHIILAVDLLKQIGNSNLLNSDTDINEPHQKVKNLPSSWVPNRNMMFLTFAHGYAQKVGAEDIIIGVSEEDYSGYPDCRGEFIMAAQQALNLGSEQQIQIRTPLLHLSKVEEWQLAYDIGAYETILNYTHTCYNGSHHSPRDWNEWGWGCGNCPACKLRQKSWQEWHQKFNKNLKEREFKGDKK